MLKCEKHWKPNANQCFGLVGRGTEHQTNYGQEVVLSGSDIADAFHQIPTQKAERKYTGVMLLGVYVGFRVLVFGCGSAPTTWWRFGAFLGRSTAAMIGTNEFRLETYVDDPVCAALGIPAENLQNLSVALLWISAVGFPLAWSKTEGGKSLWWIGACIEVVPTGASVSIPPDKATEALAFVNQALALQVISRRALRRVAGKLNFYTSIIKHMRPFLAPIWAVLSGRSSQANEGTDGGSDPPGRSPLPPDSQAPGGRFIPVRRC